MSLRLLENERTEERAVAVEAREVSASETTRCFVEKGTPRQLTLSEFLYPESVAED